MNFSTTSLKEQHELLLSQIYMLVTMPGSCLEYGNPERPGGAFSGLRIYYINTMGGLQYRLTRLSQPGIEGSGEYTPDAKEMALMAQKARDHYERPTPLRMTIDRMRQERGDSQPAHLLWFFNHNPTQKRHVVKPLPGEITINLSLNGE
jgi:hypothetical protein